MRRNLTVIVVALLALLAGAAVAVAAIPGPDGTITACYRADGIGQGQLSVIDSEETCPSGFETLTWNQGTSVPGYVVTNDSETTTDPNTQTITAIAECPTGTQPIGGGGSGNVLTESRPVSGGWQVSTRRFDPGGGGGLGAYAWAICAAT
jgi:hypothetical protein